MSKMTDRHGGALQVSFTSADEIKAGLLKKDHVSHLGDIIGALCGIVFGFYFLKYDSFVHLWEVIKTLF